MECHVSRDSFCDESSVITRGGKIFHSSLIQTSVGASTILGSQLSRLSAVDCVLDSVVADGPRLREVVAENCELYGQWRLDGIARIPCGIWHRSPRFVEINGEEFRAGITESTNGHALIACMRQPLIKWLHAGPRLGRMLGWTPEQVQIAYRTFEEWMDIPIAGTGPVGTGHIC